MPSFGGKLKELRNQKRMSLRTLAKELDISPTFLSDIENGRRLPPNSEKNFNSIDKIAEILCLTEDEINELRKCADFDLFEKGVMSKDIEQYMKQYPMAQVAMRKAVSNNVDDNKWEEIMKILEGD